jgi:hypothetical protein
VVGLDRQRLEIRGPRLSFPPEPVLEHPAAFDEEIRTPWPDRRRGRVGRRQLLPELLAA